MVAQIKIFELFPILFSRQTINTLLHEDVLKSNAKYRAVSYTKSFGTAGGIGLKFWHFYKANFNSGGGFI